MHIVKLLFGPVESEYKTELWISNEVMAAINERQDKGKILKKLKHFCVGGFVFYQGFGKPIKIEIESTYRISVCNDLFRIAGFYDGRFGTCFIAVKAFLKSKQKLNKRERDIFKKVAEIRDLKLWRKDTNEYH